MPASLKIQVFQHQVHTLFQGSVFQQLREVLFFILYYQLYTTIDSPGIIRTSWRQWLSFAKGNFVLKQRSRNAFAGQVFFHSIYPHLRKRIIITITSFKIAMAIKKNMLK